MNNKTTSKIGALNYFIENGHRKASLCCDLPKKIKIYIMLLDDLGRMIKEAFFTQPQGFSIIQMDLSQLKAGSYNFWIILDGQTFIRELQIPEQKREGWLERLKLFV